jgi:hypothetical protein
MPTTHEAGGPPARVARTRAAFLAGTAALVTAGGMQLAGCANGYGGPPADWPQSPQTADAGGGATTAPSDAGSSFAQPPPAAPVALYGAPPIINK